MTPDWSPLETELAAWHRARLRLPLWWRDDDAVSESGALHQLADLSQALGLAVHLAVIPERADDSLAAVVRHAHGLIPVVHGWAHRNHAPEGQKKAEFGAHRPLDAMTRDAARGMERLTGLFGAQLRPMFVPPWNRVSPQVIAALPALGFSMLSTFTPRDAAQAAPGLERINTHLDPIDWRGTRSLADPDRLIAQLADQLRARRHGDADIHEPYGILTHHLVHDAAIWTFTRDLLIRLLDGPADPWTAPATEPERIRPHEPT